MMLQGQGYTSLTLLNTVLLIGTNLGLDVLLVPRLGILGAAIGTGTAITVAGAAGVVEVRYLEDTHPYSLSLAKVWFSAALPLLTGISIVLLFESRALTAAVLPIAVSTTYLLALNLTDSFTDQDAEIARKIDTKLGTKAIERVVRR